MSFKDNYFKCFSCGAGGSVIDLTGGLFDLQPFESVQKLNDDFSLGLDFDSNYTVNIEKMNRIKEEKKLVKSFEKWIDETYSNYAVLAKYYLNNLKKYRPVDETIHPKYAEACHRLPIVNYILDILFEGDDQTKIELYKNMTLKEVTAVNERPRLEELTEN